MKELTIEEKAKRYDEAIAKGKQIQNTPYTAHWDTMKEVVEHLLPELKENKDKTIIKALISILKSDFEKDTTIYDISVGDIIAWLEKQGEQPKKNDVCDNCDQQGSCVSPCPMKLVEKQGEHTSILEEEGEKIRCTLINHFKMLVDLSKTWNGLKNTDILAWLEKQGNLITELQKTYAEIGRLIKENYYLKEKQDKQKPVKWSGVDNVIVEEICLALEYSNESGEKIEKYENWLHSIKDRVLLQSKQGEQKPTDKVEPKFKKNDWVRAISSGNIFKILSVNDGLYRVLCYDGVEANYPIEVEKDLAYWTIQDAKDGDVLVCPKYAGDIIPNIFIFKDIKIKDNDVFCYCSFLDTFRIESYVANADPINTDFYPATKEQCDLLFQKMKEAGYEWNAEKKELKKIEQKPVELYPVFRIGDIIERKDGQGTHLKITSIPGNFYHCIKMVYSEDDTSFCDIPIKNQDIFQISPDFGQKPAWSEEDELRMENILSVIDGHGYPMEVKWLKSLKDRVLPQPKQEWSEEDENNILFLISIIEECFKDKEKITLHSDTVCAHFTKEDVIDRLKSLRPQNRWKPSEEQMKALNIVMCGVNDPLFSLYNDLKKLKE